MTRLLYSLIICFFLAACDGSKVPDKIGDEVNQIQVRELVGGFRLHRDKQMNYSIRLNGSSEIVIPANIHYLQCTNDYIYGQRLVSRESVKKGADGWVGMFVIDVATKEARIGVLSDEIDNLRAKNSNQRVPRFLNKQNGEFPKLQCEYVVIAKSASNIKP